MYEYDSKKPTCTLGSKTVKSSVFPPIRIDGGCPVMRLTLSSVLYQNWLRAVVPAHSAQRSASMENETSVRDSAVTWAPEVSGISTANGAPLGSDGEAGLAATDAAASVETQKTEMAFIPTVTSRCVEGV